jgi:hypothetical protein
MDLRAGYAGHLDRRGTPGAARRLGAVAHDLGPVAGALDRFEQNFRPELVRARVGFPKEAGHASARV